MTKLKPGESKADIQTIRDEAEATDRERARQANEVLDRKRSEAASNAFPYAKQEGCADDICSDLTEKEAALRADIDRQSAADDLYSSPIEKELTWWERFKRWAAST